MNQFIVTFICMFLSILISIMPYDLFAKNIEQVSRSYISKGNVSNLVNDKLKRNVLSNIGTSSVTNTHQLIPLTYQNAIAWAGDKESLAIAFSSEVSLLEEHIESLLNINSYNEQQGNEEMSICSERLDDSLNFKPIAVNYHDNKGAQEKHTLVVSNNGFLQMYKASDNTYEEVWAFVPNELFTRVSIVKESNVNTAKVYGVDGTGSVHIHDVNGDGVINVNDGDKAWFYFGLGRGGKSYYAIDISQPDKPELLWHINSNTLGFSELAQTWAKVNIGFSKINLTSNGLARPVAFFPAGYDNNKDNLTVGSGDSTGRGFYMVDAQTGKLLFSATPAHTNHNNLQWLSITDSIASSLAIMDSNSDGFIDRIYVGDTGANVWRIDMPSEKPFDQLSPWTIHHFAQLRDDLSSSTATHVSEKSALGFFNEPTIARAIMPYTVAVTGSVNDDNTTMTTTVNKPYDVILLGSGNKASLLSTHTKDKFFLLKDDNIITQSFNRRDFTTTAIPKVITLGDLHDFSQVENDKFSFTQPEFKFQSQANLPINEASGWLINYKHQGEKSISSGLVVSGVVYFNSFTPSKALDFCEGSTYLYAVDLFNASVVYDVKSAEIEDAFPDTPQAILLEPELEISNNDVHLLDSNFSLDVNNNESAFVNNALAVCDITACINALPAPENLPTNNELLKDNITEALKDNITEALNVTPIKLKTIRTSLYIQEVQ